MGAASAWVRSAPRITRHLAFVIPAAAERRSPPDAAGRGAFGNIIGEPTTDQQRGTTSSNPSPSSGESANFRFLRRAIAREEAASQEPSSARQVDMMVSGTVRAALMLRLMGRG